MHDGGDGEEHGEVVEPLRVVQVCGVENCGADADAEDAGVGHVAEDGIGAGMVFAEAMAGVNNCVVVSEGSQKKGIENWQPSRVGSEIGGKRSYRL